MKKLIFLLGMIFIFSSAILAQTPQNVGAIKCKMCHNKPEKGEQYNKWASGPHAKAMESLKGADATNPKCLKCHSTPGLKDGVSCESCHGPGSIYKSASVMKDQKLALSKGMILPEEKVCKQCHNEESPNYKGFNYSEYKAKISHSTPK